MDRPLEPDRVLVAPAASQTAEQHCPGRLGPRLPAVDDVIVTPETREEILRGTRLIAFPAREPHARHHLDIGFLIRAHLRPGYAAAVDMLTRTSQDSNFAPDVSVYPAERDPETGGRKLEELAFEIVSRQPLRVTTIKAQELAARGVRRIFCIVLKKQQVLEWSHRASTWELLSTDGVIEDPTLGSLPVKALLDAGEIEKEAVRALDLADGVAIQALKGRERKRGGLRGLADAVLAVCESRDLMLSLNERARILSCTDQAALMSWLKRAAIASKAEDVFGDL